MAKITNTFNQGMDQDSSKNKYDDKHYYAAENARIFSQDGLSAGALEDFKGTLERLDISGKTPVGYCVLRDDIILFLTNNPGDTPSAVLDDYIVRVPIEELEALTTDTQYVVDFVNYHVAPADGYNLIYTEKLSFCKVNPIKAIPRYENEIIQKVYWVDGYNNLRWLNTVYDADTNDLVNLPPDHLEVIGDFDLTQPEVINGISGELLAGKVQYAYQLYMLNGSQTVFSPPTPLYHITEADDIQGNSRNYYGSDIGEITSKGYEGLVTITAGQYYSRCRVIAIHYSTFSDEPEIRIISETDIIIGGGFDYVTFRDIGQTLGNLTLEELRILSTSIFSAADIETKDNILFPANISEDAFDVEYDARAYRFNGKGGISGDHNYVSPGPEGFSRLYEADGSYYLIDESDTSWTSVGGGTATGSGANWSTIPTVADCINYYNDIVLDNHPDSAVTDYPWEYKYRYKRNGATAGGEGPNVSYTFGTTPVQVNWADPTPIWPISYQTFTLFYGVEPDYSYYGQESPYRGAHNVGYQHDEVYRFGVVFFDDKGRNSFVKWIGDIRIPSASFPAQGDWSQGLVYISGSPPWTYGNVPYVEFVVNNMPPGAVSYQIVRVKRDTNDKTILAQGMVNQPTETSTSPDTVCFDRWRITGNLPHGLFQFQSPEVAFNKNLSFKQSVDYFEEVGDANAGNVITYTPSDPLSTEQMDLTIYPTFNVWTPLEEVDNERRTNIENGQVVTQQEAEVNIGGTIYIVHSGDTTETQLRASKGIFFLWEIPNVHSFNPEFADYDDYSLVNYRRNIFESQYGGITFYARKNSEYIIAGNINEGTVFGGDTYISMFDYGYSAHGQGYGVRSTGLGCDAVYFPCETAFNLPLRNHEHYSRVHEDQNAGFIHDTAGVWDDDATRFYFQERDLYVYNSAYSRPNDTRIFIDAPFDWTALTNFDSRIIASLTKTNGESRDSWLQYPANQVIDVDPQYGPVKAVKVVNNRLLYFQDSAFGIVSVNDRALIETGSVSQLSLGVSGLLDRYDYAMTNVGCYHWRHLTLTPNALYWVDLKNKAMYRYGKGPEELSLMKGMDTWFRSTIPDEDIGDKKSHYKIDDGMHLFHDPEYREVYFVVDDSDTIIYNEVTNSFTTFSSINPHFTVNYLDKLLGIQVADDSFLRHNDFYAERGHLYGIQRSLSVTLLINPNPDNVAVFNNFEWLTEATLNGIDQPETWYSIQAYNDYQDTGIIMLVPGDNVKRRMRKWRYTIPRGVRDKNGVLLTDDQRYARMRDSYMMAKFTYLNVGSVPNKEFIVHDIITSYTISNS